MLQIFKKLVNLKLYMSATDLPIYDLHGGSADHRKKIGMNTVLLRYASPGTKCEAQKVKANVFTCILTIGILTMDVSPIELKK